MPRKKGFKMSTPDVRSLARAHTKRAIQVLAQMMNCETQSGMTRIAAAKVLIDRGWGRADESHHLEINGEKTLLKVVNEIVHVHETREQIEFRDQVPLLELAPEDSDDNGSKSTH